MRGSLIVFGTLMVLVVLLIALPIIDKNINLNPYWGILSLAVVGLAVLAMFFEFGEGRTSKEITITAMLGALSAMIRVPFGAIPSLQPSTFIIASTGYVFGPVSGFMVGALTALVSNFFLGTGPWTLYQMLAWGLVGMFFALLGKLKMPKWSLAGFGLLWGYLFGFIMNLWYLTAFGFPISVKSVIALQAASCWMDTLHGVGTFVFFLVFGKRVISILERFKQRFLGQTVK